MNIKFIHGRFVRDPELTENKNDENRNRCKFTIATDRRFGDETDYHDCIVFGKRAKVVAKYFSKGSEIVLCGEEQSNSYEGKDGVKRKSWTVVVSDFDFCGSKKESKSDDIPDSFEKAQGDIPF